MKAPSVIRHYGKAVRANLDGMTIYREDLIYVKADHCTYRIIDTQDHFCYEQPLYLGPTLVCTCGSLAGIYGYEAYQQFQSTNQGRIICCTSLVENGCHADGSRG